MGDEGGELGRERQHSYPHVPGEKREDAAVKDVAVRIGRHDQPMNHLYDIRQGVEAGADRVPGKVLHGELLVALGRPGVAQEALVGVLDLADVLPQVVHALLELLALGHLVEEGVEDELGAVLDAALDQLDLPRYLPDVRHQPLLHHLHEGEVALLAAGRLGLDQVVRLEDVGHDLAAELEHLGHVAEVDVDRAARIPEQQQQAEQRRRSSHL